MYSDEQKKQAIKKIEADLEEFKRLETSEEHGNPLIKILIQGAKETLRRILNDENL